MAFFRLLFKMLKMSVYKASSQTCGAQGLVPVARMISLFLVLTTLSIFLAVTLYIRTFNSPRIVAMPESSAKLLGVKPLLARSENSEPSFKVQRFKEMAGLFQQKRVNCSALYLGDQNSTKRAMAIAKVLAAEEERLHFKKDTKQRRQIEKDVEAKILEPEVKKWAWEFLRLTNQWYLNATRDCKWFKQTRGYITSSLTREERDFPIAFSLLVFKDLEMVERLLRSVYRPQNRYCIHVDSKSDPKFFSALKSVAACFPENVRMSSRRVDVRWGTFTVLEPELICMQDLWDMDENTTSDGDKISDRTDNSHQPNTQRKRTKNKWKYFINLTGQEFPLKTNHELVKILKSYKGANNGEGTRKRANKDRWKTKPPHGIIPTKGGVHTLLNRATVNFLLRNDTAKDFIAWLKTTHVPDETLFASIIYNPQLNIPGTYNGTNLEQNVGFNRYKQWWGHNCYANRVTRGICIISAGDLPRLGEAPKLFANKFYLHQDRVVIGCLEEKLFNNTRDEFLGVKTFNTTFYETQDFVIHQVPGKPFL